MPYKDKQRQKEAQREHYIKNKDAYADRLRIRRKKSREYVKGIREKSQCSNCEERRVECLDFHHIGTKTKNISILVREATGIERLLAEIEQCVILCANCHSIEHYKEASQNNTYLDKNRIKKREWYREYKKTLHCAKCGIIDYRCLDFHHTKDKKFRIAYMITSGHSIESVKEEMAKCTVLCKNCHRFETHGEPYNLPC